METILGFKDPFDTCGGGEGWSFEDGNVSMVQMVLSWIVRNVTKYSCYWMKPETEDTFF